MKEIAKIRLEYPELSLREMGQMLSKPIGRSGVNHRMKRLSAIAESLRGKEAD
ncbi:MAG TPA: DNA-binding protein WhiA [Oscillospiraceae bacterium]|nr:DNA-binding protein WhiA [Oscillospiraceae bacterium]